MAAKNRVGLKRRVWVYFIGHKWNLEGGGPDGSLLKAFLRLLKKTKKALFLRAGEFFGKCL